MEITWYGRACFRLKGKDATVITDPCPPSTGFVAGKHDVDLLTISHDHPDHTYTRSITAGLTLTRPGEYEFSDLLVTGIRTFHDGEAGGSRGENMVFAVEIDGVHICHLGDLGHLLTDEQLTELGPVDVLLVPVGGNFTIAAAEAAEVVRGPDVDLLERAGRRALADPILARLAWELAAISLKGCRRLGTGFISEPYQEEAADFFSALTG